MFFYYTKKEAYSPLNLFIKFLYFKSEIKPVNPINIKAIDPHSQTITFNNNLSIKYSRGYKKVVNDEIIEKYNDINLI